MQQLWATFCRKLEATSNLPLKQIRLAYTQNIYDKQHLLGEGSHFIGITGEISPLVFEIVSQQVLTYNIKLGYSVIIKIASYFYFLLL